MPELTELTDGVVLVRSPRTEDVDGLLAAVRASADALSRWMVWWREDYGRRDAEEWMRSASIIGDHPFVIIELSDGTVVGSCGLNAVNHQDSRANLGYWIRSDRIRRGLASRAARLVARHGITDMGLHRIEILAAVGNIPSQRTAARAGAHFEGVQRNRVRLRDEWVDAAMFSLVPTDPAMGDGYRQFASAGTPPHDDADAVSKAQGVR